MYTTALGLFYVSPGGPIQILSPRGVQELYLLSHFSSPVIHLFENYMAQMDCVCVPDFQALHMIPDGIIQQRQSPVGKLLLL